MNTIKTRLFSLSLVLTLAITIIGLSSWRSPQDLKSATDTTKSKKQCAQYSKKTIITIDENGNAHEQVIEDFEGDENLRELLDENMNFNFDFPPFPDLDITIPEIPDMPSFYFNLDSGDFKSFHFDGDWEHLGDSFNEFGPDLQARLESLNDQLKDLDIQLNLDLNQNLDSHMRHLDESLRNMNFNLEKLGDLDIHLDHLKELEKLDEFSFDYGDQLKAFEEAVQEELIKDSYLQKGEKLESINWTDDEIKFNGTPIKEEHLDKYRDLQQKYMKRKWKGRIE